MVKADRINLRLPMVYGISKIVQVIAQGYYKNRRFFVLNMYGDHPCAYVSAPDFRGEDCETVDVEYNPHGGFTYAEDYLRAASVKDPMREKQLRGWFLGWDYGHSGDFCVEDLEFAKYCPHILENKKKWNTDEIILECYKVIEGMPAVVE